MSGLLEFRDLSFEYQQRSSSEESFGLRNISAEIPEGDFVSVIGKNGSGKSTLIRLISRSLTGYTGSIRFRGEEISRAERKEYSRNVSYLPQSVSAGFDLTAESFLLLGRYPHKGAADFRFNADDRKVTDACISELGIEHLRKKKLSGLSGGERQKVMIALSLVQLDITGDLKGKLLAVDEPLTFLDVNHQFEILGILKMLQEKKLTVIIVIHDLNLALRNSDKTMLLNNGRLIRYSDTKDVITEDVIREHFLIESKIMNFEKNFFINYLP